MLTPDFSPFPQLETERLLLNQITTNDAEALFTLRSNKDVMQYIGRPVAKAVDEALALIKVITEAQHANDGITWGIFTKEEPQMLMGTIGFWRMQKEHYRAEIGYLLHPSLQGKGLMKEAMNAVLNYGFTVLKLHSVEANVSPDSEASRQLLLKAGFKQEAYFKENYFSNGCFVDSVIYSLLTPVK